MIQRFNVGVGQDFCLNGSLYVGTFHEVGVGYFIGVVEILLSQTCQRSYLGDAQFILILLEKIEQVFVENPLDERLQNLQMRIVSIREAGVNKTGIIEGPHPVEEVVGYFGTLHGLLFGAVEFLPRQEDRFIEVHDAQIVEATEDIVVDVILHELVLGVEGIVPGDLQVVNGQPVLLVPVQVLAHQNCVPQVHLKGWNVLVDDIHAGFVVVQGGHLVSELGYLVHHFSELKSDLLVLGLLEVLDHRLNEVGGVGTLEGIERLHSNKDIFTYKI